MNKIIEKYLTMNHPELNIRSILGAFNLRFELGGEVLKNGTIERVNQAVSRATEIYQQAIGNSELILVIEEYETDIFDIEKRNKGYLSQLLPLDTFAKFKELDCDIWIGKQYIDEKTIHKIIRGRANLEMGFDPAVPQDIYYYSIANEVGFRIYDDRGCDVWSNDKEKLRPIYESLNQWILDYNRPEIDAYFK